MEETGFFDFRNGSYFEEEFIRSIDKDNLFKQWLLVRTPVPVAAILLSYMYFILKLGPQLMKHRSPLDLRFVMQMYDVAQVIGNVIYITYPLIFHPGSIQYAIKTSCEVPTTSKINEWRNLLMTQYWYFLSLKILDLLDTVFMVLRKKNHHITFLHVYHHVAMVFFTWFSITYHISHHAVLPGYINAFVHSVMYSYYFLATYGPSTQRFLWWKKHLTKLQLAQFVAILVYFFVLYYNKCPVSITFSFIWIFNTFVILCLFINFYVKSYIFNKPVSDTKSKNL